jgi:hypothetical protein
MVTSFTDKMPLVGWTNLHAVRELWQNFRDGLADTFGAKGLVIKQNSPTQYFVESNGKIVGELNCQREGFLTIRQEGCNLKLHHLQLASDKGTDHAGGHGEGFKVAIALLLRNGYGVTYKMKDYEWIFKFENEYDKYRNMIVYATPSEIPRTCLEIIISGNGANRLFDPIIDLSLVTSLGRLLDVGCTNSGGSVFMVPPRDYLVGAVYCHGLFVDVNEELKKLRIAANVETKLGRDRHRLPIETWNLIGDILLSGAHVQNSTQLFEHLLKIIQTSAIEDLERYLRAPMRKYLSIRNKIPENMVIFLKDAPDRDFDLLTSMGYYTFKNKTLGDQISMTDKISKYLQKLPTCEEKLNRADKEALRYLQNFFESVHKHTALNLLITVRVKEFPETFFEFSTCFLDPPFLVDVHPSSITLDQIGSTAMLIFMMFVSRYDIQKEFSIVARIQGIFARGKRF